MALVLAGVDQKITVKLLDMVFGKGNRIPMGKDGLHDLGVAGDLLLVASRE